MPQTSWLTTYHRENVMSYMSFCQILAITALAFFPLTPWAPADEQVPFAARLEGFADPKFNQDGTISNTELAVGQATHLGLVIWESAELATPTGPDTLHVEGSFTMTAADGDQVFGIYETTGTINWELFTGRFIGCYEVTGGTGRFAKVTGAGVIIGDGNLLEPYEIVGSLTGSTSPPNQ
jgi:hypothetical protein